MLRFLEFYNVERIGVHVYRRRGDRRPNPFDVYNDCEFRKRYRFSKNGVKHILRFIEDDLEVITNRNNPVPPLLQLLVTLRFYATGDFQMTDGDLFGIHQTTVQRIVHRISRLIASHSQTYIKFPSLDEQRARCIRFYEIAGFPGTIGLIDGTHIKIEKPATENSELYRNRKSYFSINVQLMMTADFKIADIVSRWYRSAHDSRILTNSQLYNKLENLPSGSWLLGDSGYPCLRFLLTPFLRPSNCPEERYNAAHIKTRNLIERGIGLWKRRFPVVQVWTSC